MNEEKLIDIVRKYPFLYDVTHPKYSDTIKKNQAWKEIAEELRDSAGACKQKWQSLRDCFRRALNKRKRKTGPAAKKIKKWKYEEEMTFLIPLFAERNSLSSLNISSGESETETVQYDHSENVDSAATDPTDVAYSTADDYNGDNTQITENYVPKKLKIETGSTEMPTASSMGYLLEEKKKTAPTAAQGELDFFFSFISATVKKFSPYQQAVAKNQIFTLVSEMELQQFSSWPQSNSNEPDPLLSTSATGSGYSSQQHVIPMPTSPPDLDLKHS
ncbi:hypothetical protein JTB14_033814 [Gonioctena quinquepunctata]|nr:hypothetical protein JTB14_033814 [Gonioctena quinquepunctata]